VDSTSTASRFPSASRIEIDAAHVALVERDHPWKLAAHAIASAHRGRGAGVLYEGAPGMGKSGLLTAIRALARESGTQVLWAAGRRREAQFPFGVVLQLLESRADGADLDGVGRWLVEVPRPEASLKQLHSLYRSYVEVAASSPLALVVDDADLADQPSLASLLYLIERVAELPVAVILTAGTVSPREVASELHDIARHPVTARCRLEPLTPGGTARWLGKRWLPGTVDQLAEEIHEESSGNRFLVDALAAAVVAPGGGLFGTDVHQLAPHQIADWATAQAAELDSRAPDLLAAVAIGGEDCELRHVAAIAGVDAESAAELVDALCEIGLLAVGDRVSFAHPVVGRAVAAAVAPGARGLMNLRAARALAAEDASPERVAAHLLGASRTKSGWVVDTLRTAAQVALARAAPSDAVRYLRRALEEPPPPHERVQVVVELGRAEAVAGEPRAAARLRGAVEQLKQAPEQPDAALAAGRTLLALGRVQQALAVFERALANARDAEPGLVARLRAGQATAVWMIELPHGDRRHSPDPSTAGDSPGDRALVALQAIEAAIRGVPCLEVKALAERALGQGALLEDETADGISYYLAVGALAYAEDLTGAEAAATAAVDDALGRGSVLGLGNASHTRAGVILLRGRLVDAAAEARRALSVERRGWTSGIAGARVVLATTLMEQGDLDGARRELEAAERVAGEVDPFGLGFLLARGRLRLMRGEAAGGLEDFLACGRLADRAAATNPSVAPWRSHAGLAMAALGDTSEAERLVDVELTLAEAFGAPGPVGRALWAMASISEPKRARDALEAAVDSLRASEAILDRARALIDFGAALRRSGRRRAAREPLMEGLALAERCGAAVLSKRAFSEMRLAGARPRRTAIHGRAALTAREQEVASLAAEGLSNRKIAERLVVTTKTVEWHLSHCFAKLGVRSRRELRESLARSDSTSAPP
jgi:DNA-binding CsgD family transcriptional regulator